MSRTSSRGPTPNVHGHHGPAHSTAHEVRSGFRNGRLHALSDAELRASGLPYTIIRPSAFMQNLLGSVVGGTLYHNWGDGRVGLIDARDVAEFAARVLTRPADHAGRTYTITGPASVSMSDAAAQLATALGRPISAQHVRADAVAEGMTRVGLPHWVADVAAHEYAPAYASGWGDYTTRDFTNVVGHAPRSVSQFAADHAPYFQDGPQTG